jgi:hypothetical protein
VASINSVGFGLNSIAESSPSTPSPTRTTATAAPGSQDIVEIATVPSMSQLEPLQSGNPSQFQAVLSDAVRQLRAAAWQATDPIEAAYLSGLADRFQRLEETGIPDQLASSAAAGK